MYVENITLIDEGDVIAFIDDLQFEYEGVHEITEDEALTIDWMTVNKAQITGTLVVLNVTYEQTNWISQHTVTDHTRVLVFEED
jgi:hypothetical protein